jgi:Tol biopolymer transport system component
MRIPLVCSTALCLLLASAPGDGIAKEKLPVLAYADDGAGSLDVFVTRAGDEPPQRLTASRQDDFSPSWSPDGQRIAYRVNPRRSDVGDIWVMRADGTRKRNLTRTPRVAEWSPAFSPDGTRIAYYSNAVGVGDVWIMRSDGTVRRNVTRNGALNEYPTWSPDGGNLAFNSHRDGQFEVYRATVGGTRQRNLTRHPGKDQWPAWSSDGRHIAFMSDRDGSEDVFVMRADGSRVRNVTETPTLDESHPTWMPDGRLSFTRHGETGPIELWAVEVEGIGAWHLDTPAEPVFVFAWKPR